MLRVETETACYWRSAQLAHNCPFFLLAMAGFDCLVDIARFADSPRLRSAASRHLAVSAEYRRVGNITGLTGFAAPVTDLTGEGAQ